MIWIIGIALMILLDFVSKRLVMKCLQMHITQSVLGDWLHITYVQNRGAAFGMLQNQRWIFIVVTIAVLVAMVLYWTITKPKSKWLKTSLMFIFAGAVGNLIDRVFYGFVVDFLFVKIINFPVFNVADIFVVTGVIMLCIYIMFSDIGKKENPLENDIKLFEEYNKETSEEEEEN